MTSPVEDGPSIHHADLAGLGGTGRYLDPVSKFDSSHNCVTPAMDSVG